MKYAQFIRFEIAMTQEQAESANHSGECLYDVIELLKNPAIKAQLAKIPDKDLQAELEEFGAWSAEELRDRENNERRIIWIAAGNITEDDQEEK